MTADRKAANAAPAGKIRETGSSIGANAPVYDFQEFCRLMGFEDVWEFEKKWAKAA